MDWANMKLRGAVALICIGLLATESCKDDEPTETPFVKEIYSYKSVIIGTQEWMAEDLKNNSFCNDEPIPEVKDAAQWITLKKAGWSYIENDKGKYGSMGKLYNWYAVDDERNICPCGWHVPSWDDLMELKVFLGGEDKAGGMMKTTGTIQSLDGLWYEPNTGATNSVGFSGVPNGLRGANGAFFFEPYNATWWTSNGNYLDPEPTTFALHYGNEKLSLGAAEKKNGFAVRCIKD